MDERQSNSNNKKNSLSKKALIGICLGAFFAVILIGGLVYAYPILWNQKSIFDTTEDQATNTNFEPTQKPTVIPGVTGEELPEQTMTPEEYIASIADRGFMNDIVNVLLIGVDYSDERVSGNKGWNGKLDYHADVMLILSINFKENRVDLISFPRDSYVKIPGVEGPYRMNASLDCGGGYPAGIPKVLETVQWQLGGIPVKYYYCVTMPVLKEVVDAVGGLYYDVDVDFKMSGRVYKKGMQFLNGQAFLDYCRTRKQAEDPGDKNRVNRQKNILKELFRTLKGNGGLAKLPDLIQVFEGKLLTNMTLQQTAALAVFGQSLPDANIGMHSMDGPSSSELFDGIVLVLCNQTSRVNLIKQIYGVTVPQHKDYSKEGAYETWTKMQADAYLKVAQNFLTFYKTADKKIETEVEIVDPETGEITKEVQVGEMPDLTESLLAAVQKVENANNYSERQKALAELQLLFNATAAKFAKPLDWTVKIHRQIPVDLR